MTDTIRIGGSAFEKIRVDNHLYVFYEGDLIYKQWLRPDGSKSEPSGLFNQGHLWGYQKIIRHEPPIEDDCNEDE